MQATTRQMIETALTGDATTNLAERKAILAFADGQEPMVKPKLLTTKEAAAILDCSEKTLTRYVAQGLIKQIRFTCRRVRYDEAEIIRFARMGVCNES